MSEEAKKAFFVLPCLYIVSSTKFRREKTAKTLSLLESHLPPTYFANPNLFQVPTFSLKNTIAKETIDFMHQPRRPSIFLSSIKYYILPNYERIY
jgi:hypothetical protein